MHAHCTSMAVRSESGVLSSVDRFARPRRVVVWIAMGSCLAHYLPIEHRVGQDWVPSLTSEWGSLEIRLLRLFGVSRAPPSTDAT
jgi:hypothetical protein